MILSSFLTELKQRGSSPQALAHAAYHKSNREHWGVPVPQIIALVKSSIEGKTEERILAFAQELWDTNLFDPMICAAKMLGSSKVAPSEKLWNMLLSWMEKLDGWALEDQLSPAASKCILENLERLDTVETWTKHKSFWIRRAALVYTLAFAKRGKNPERMLYWASMYASDSEWFIQKAVGWWLRTLAPHNPQRVRLFLQEHGFLLKSVALKEATRKLPTEM